MAPAICLSIWLCINNFVFKQKLVCSLAEVVFLVIHWLRTWVILGKAYTLTLVLKAC
jgi:hypothetical protein